MRRNARRIARRIARRGARLAEAERSMRSRSREVLPGRAGRPRGTAPAPSRRRRSIRTRRRAAPSGAPCRRRATASATSASAIGGGSEVGLLEPPDLPPAAGAAGFDAPARRSGRSTPSRSRCRSSRRPAGARGRRRPPRRRAPGSPSARAPCAPPRSPPASPACPAARACSACPSRAKSFRSRCRLFWNHTCTCRGDTLSFRASSRRVSRPANAKEAVRRLSGEEAAPRATWDARRGVAGEQARQRRPRPNCVSRALFEGVSAARAWEWVRVVHLFEHAERAGSDLPPRHLRPLVVLEELHRHRKCEVHYRRRRRTRPAMLLRCVARDRNLPVK